MTDPAPRVAKDIMVVDLVTLTPDVDVFEGIDRLLEKRVTGAPVIADGNQYRGMFSERCCMQTLTDAATAAHVEGVRAKHLMSTGLLAFAPETDAFEAIQQLIKHRVSGAPVVDSDGRYLGVFSEKTSMKMLLDAIYEQRPTDNVGSHMDPDDGRLINEQTDFLTITRTFLYTVYRRLPVVEDGILVGQVSRREVLQTAQVMRGTGSIHAGSSGSQRVADVIDSDSRTISPDDQLLSIVQIFGQTQLRRLPVLLPDGRLIGQVSRRDVLRTALSLTDAAPTRERAMLYLSALLHKNEAPI